MSLLCLSSVFYWTVAQRMVKRMVSGVVYGVGYVIWGVRLGFFGRSRVLFICCAASLSAASSPQLFWTVALKIRPSDDTLVRMMVSVKGVVVFWGGSSTLGVCQLGCFCVSKVIVVTVTGARGVGSRSF